MYLHPLIYLQPYPEQRNAQPYIQSTHHIRISILWWNIQTNSSHGPLNFQPFNRFNVFYTYIYNLKWKLLIVWLCYYFLSLSSVGKLLRAVGWTVFNSFNWRLWWTVARKAQSVWKCADVVLIRKLKRGCDGGGV